MNKTIAIIILVLCFIVGFWSGSDVSFNPTEQTVSKEIEQYEAGLDSPPSDFVPISEREESLITPPVAHNNVSQFGHDAGEMLKTWVREILRSCIIAIDQLISE